MTRIILTKYGFTRFPEEDFHDDGNNFTCYRFSDTNSHVSKLVSDGQVYLSAHVNGQLPYEVYSEFPNYKTATWSFNGISVASLTDEMLQDFFKACVQYEKEYQAAEAAIEYPSECELLAKCIRIQNKLLLETNELETLMGEHAVEAATKFSKWEWQKLQEYLTYMLQELSILRSLFLMFSEPPEALPFFRIKKTLNPTTGISLSKKCSRSIQLFNPQAKHTEK